MPSVLVVPVQAAVQLPRPDSVVGAIPMRRRLTPHRVSSPTEYRQLTATADKSGFSPTRVVAGRPDRNSTV